MNRRASIFLLFLLISYGTAISQIRYEKIDYYMYLFAKNTEWPATVLSDTFYIGVVGETQANQRLQLLADKNAMKGKATILKVFANKEEVGFCHLLFVPAVFSQDLKAILSKTHNSTLVVTESMGHALKGSAINIIWESEFSTKMRFEVNRSAFEKGGLILSSELASIKSP